VNFRLTSHRHLRLQHNKLENKALLDFPTKNPTVLVNYWNKLIHSHVRAFSVGDAMHSKKM
jgi:hypothetical protein